MDGSKKKNTNGPLKEPNNHSSGITKSVNDIESNETSNSTQATSSTSLASSTSSPLVGSAITDYNRRTTNNVQQNHALNVERYANLDNIVKTHNGNNNNNNNNNNISNGKISSSDNNYVLRSPLLPPPGCGCVIGASSPEPDEITISITPTTGGQFELTVERNETIENLKKIISKRLKVAKERICLLHRDRQLREGTLRENRLQDGSRLTLLPSVETGLMGQRPEQSVMQALESLNDSQVNDFLSGKAPLNLTMRLGDQMMLIQLQLSTVQPASPSTTSNNNSVSPSCVPVTSASAECLGAGSQSSSNPTVNNNSSSTNTGTTTTSMQSSSGCQSSNLGTTNSSSSSASSMSSASSSSSSFSSMMRSLSLRRSAILAARNARASSFINSLAAVLQTAAGCNNNTSSTLSNGTSLTTATTTTNSCQSIERTTDSPTSPPNSPTYNSVPSSSRLSRPPFYRPSGTQNSSTPSPATSTTALSSPSSSASSSSSLSSSSSSPSSSSSSSSPSSSSPPATTALSSNNTSRANYRNRIAGIPYIIQRQHHRHQYHHSHHHHHRHHYRNKHLSATSSNSSSSLSSSSSTSAGCETSQRQDTSTIPIPSHILDEPMETNTSLPCTPQNKKLYNAHLYHHNHHRHNNSQQQNYTSMSGHQQEIQSGSPDSPSSPQIPNSSIVGLGNSSKVSATLDTRALAEASRNLTQKLKQLSSEVLTSRVDLAEEHARRRQGAIIESMHHHGKGVYSGTFSGTLNPALQDRHGRPKRDISTIIHILNDLLCATPAATAGPYRHHHRHISGCLQSSSNIAGTSDVSSGNGTGSSGSNSGTYHDEELSKENEATKGKMRRLRLVMEQRRAKMKARRQARAAPYTTQWAALTPDPSTSTSTSTSGPSGNSTESQNEPELQPCSPEPVVA